MTRKSIWIVKRKRVFKENFGGYGAAEQEMREKKKVDFKRKYRDFSGGPLVRNPSANVGDTV